MNNLSWFLYLADTLGNVSATILVFSTILFIGAIFVCILGYVEENPYLVKLSLQICGGVVLACLLCAFIPSTNTMYAIAASELGESALKSETGKQVEKALLNWIEIQLDTKKLAPTDK